MGSLGHPNACIKTSRMSPTATDAIDVQQELQQDESEGFEEGDSDGACEGVHKPARQSTASYLEDLTRILFTTIKPGVAGNLTLLRKHLHPDFVLVNESVHDCLIPQAKGIDATMALIESYAKSEMVCQLEPFNVTALVHRGTRHAQVYFTMRESAISFGKVIGREICSVVFWRRQPEDGLWVAYRHSSIRGPALFNLA